MQTLLRILLLASLSLGTAAAARAAEVCNAGFPGENSAQILQRLPKALADCPSPAAVVLFVGMNDAVNEKRFLTPAQTTNSIEQILKLIAAAHAKALVVTVHYPDEARLMQRHSLESFGGLTPAQRIDATNAAILQAAKQDHATIVDFHSVLAKAGGATTALSTDGVHLMPPGYALLAKSVASAIPRSAARGKILCLGDSLTYGIGVRAADAPDAGSDSYPQQLKRLLSPAL